MSYRRMAMNGFLDDVRDWVLDEESTMGTDGGDVTYREYSSKAPDPAMPTTLDAPIGTAIPTHCLDAPNWEPGMTLTSCPACFAEGYVRVPVSAKNPQGWEIDKWTPDTCEGGTSNTNTLTAGDNPVSTFLRDLFGGGPSTPNTLPGPTTGPSVPSGGGNVLAPPPASVVSPGAAAFTVTPVHLAVAGICALGLGYAAYKYI